MFTLETVIYADAEHIAPGLGRDRRNYQRSSSVAGHSALKRTKLWPRQTLAIDRGRSEFRFDMQRSVGGEFAV